MKKLKWTPPTAFGLGDPLATNAAEAEPEPLTLETLFDIYGDEVTPSKGRHSRQHGPVAARLESAKLRGLRAPSEKKPTG